MSIDPKDLLPCPFCGGEAELTGDCDMVTVKCSTCEATTSGWWDEPEEAAEDWNRRSALPELAAEVIRLREIEKAAREVQKQWERDCEGGGDCTGYPEYCPHCAISNLKQALGADAEEKSRLVPYPRDVFGTYHGGGI